MQARPSTVLLAILSGFQRRGRWNVPQKLTTFTFWGGGVIDLRYADFTSPEVNIRAYSIMGGQTILLPPEVNVTVDGSGVMGGFDHVEEHGSPAHRRSGSTVSPSGATSASSARTAGRTAGRRQLAAILRCRDRCRLVVVVVAGIFAGIVLVVIVALVVVLGTGDALDDVLDLVPDVVDPFLEGFPAFLGGLAALLKTPANTSRRSSALVLLTSPGSSTAAASGCSTSVCGAVEGWKFWMAAV